MKRFGKILCVVDPEETMDTAIMQAIRIADDHQANITFMSVLKPIKPWRKIFRDQEEYAKELDSFINNRQASIESRVQSFAPAMKANILVVSGIDFIEIIKHATQHQHDLVIKCAEDSDWIDRMFGSEDMHLLRKCPCPVLMLKPDQKDSFRRLLATVDVNDLFDASDEARVQDKLNQKVLEYSATFSVPALSEMHIGSAWEAYAEDFLRHGAFSSTPEDQIDRYVEQELNECSTKLEALVKKMKEMLGEATVQYLQPTPHLVKGIPSKEIPLMVENYGIDLIVMGTVGRVGIPGLIIGNTAESILEQTKCSVLAIKPEGFQTPIE